MNESYLIEILVKLGGVINGLAFMCLVVSIFIPPYYYVIVEPEPNEDACMRKGKLLMRLMQVCPYVLLLWVAAFLYPPKEVLLKLLNP